MSERETMTVGAWFDAPDDEAKRVYSHSMTLGGWVGEWGWVALDARCIPVATGPETGQAGRDAADAALRAAGVVLL